MRISMTRENILSKDIGFDKIGDIKLSFYIFI